MFARQANPFMKGGKGGEASHPQVLLWARVRQATQAAGRGDSAVAQASSQPTGAEGLTFLKSKVLVEQVPTQVEETVIVKKSQAEQLREHMTEWMSDPRAAGLFSSEAAALAEGLIVASGADKDRQEANVDTEMECEVEKEQEV